MHEHDCFTMTEMHIKDRIFEALHDVGKMMRYLSLDSAQVFFRGRWTFYSNLDDAIIFGIVLE